MAVHRARCNVGQGEPPSRPLPGSGHCLNRHLPTVPLPWPIGMGTSGQPQKWARVGISGRPPIQSAVP
jgi:hypothetical protein